MCGLIFFRHWHLFSYSSGFIFTQRSIDGCRKLMSYTKGTNAMFTVEVKIKGQLILARSCNRIAGASGELCLYVADDGRFIEHHYDAGAAALATRLLSGVTNILKAPHQGRSDRWERKQYRAEHANGQERRHPNDSAPGKRTPKHQPKRRSRGARADARPRV